MQLTYQDEWDKLLEQGYQIRKHQGKWQIRIQGKWKSLANKQEGGSHAVPSPKGAVLSG